MESKILNFYSEHTDFVLFMTGLISVVTFVCFLILVDDVHAIRHYLKNLHKNDKTQ